MSFASCNGEELERATVHVPFTGVWFADLSFIDEAPTVIGGQKVTLTIGSVNFVGTLDPTHTGVFGFRNQARLVGGANGWQRPIGARAYTNDAGVKALDVAQAAATEAGETLASFSGGASRLGAHYVRESGSASRTIEDVARGAQWWVDYDGTTTVGTRASVAAPGPYQILEYDPRNNTAILTVDSVDAVNVGQTIVDANRLPHPVTIRSMEISVAPEALRINVWCGVAGETQTAQLLRNFVQRVTDQRLTGKFKYRVVRTIANRVDLQWVKRSTAIVTPPDVTSVEMAPGLAGSHATLTPGAIVYVEFVEGLRDEPIITSFEGRGNPAAVPQKIQLGGPNNFSGVARQNDTVSCPLPPMVVNGTITIGGTPSPFTGVLMAATGTVLGSITTCSDNVEAGNS